MRPVASLIEEACEAGYLRSLRSAAVALRAAAEAFIAMELNEADPSDDLPTMKRAMDGLGAAPGFLRLPHYKRGSTRTHLTTIWNLGDSGAHLRLRDSTRQVILQPDKVDDAVRAFELVLSDVYGWP